MPLVDDLKLPATDEELSRRKLLGLVGAGALGLAGLGTAITSIKFLEPSVLFEEATRFPVGRPEDIAPGAVLVLLKQKVFVVHGPDGFYALSTVCTHLGCMTRFQKDENVIACPCHGSRFSLTGKVVGGPAPKPLPRFELVVERGQLVVDTSRPVEGTAVLKVA